MVALYETLNRSMRWITVESCIYESLIILHYYLLFRAVPLELYGKIGAAMSIIYLIVYRTCGGLEEILGSFYTHWSSSKQGFRRYLSWQYALLYSIVLSATALLFWWKGFYASPLYIVIAATTLLECTKKSMRSLLKIIFYNRLVAITEVLTMASYFTIIWGSYLQGYPITIMSIIWPLGLISVFGNIVYAIACIKWYRTLPETASDTSLSLRRILKTIAFSYANQASTVFFSSNFLVPLIAWHDSFAAAGIIKFTSTAINSITKIIDKVFGSSSSAILAHVKDNLAHKQYYFSVISNRFLQVVTALIIFIAINVSAISTRLEQPTIILYLIIIYFLITIVDRMTTIYERFFIINEHSTQLIAVNGVCGLLLFLLFNSQLHTNTILVMALLLRVASLCSLAAISYRAWQIKPSLSVRAPYLLGVVSCSVIFLLLTR